MPILTQQLAPKPARILAVVGSAIFIIALATLFGREMESFADFRVTYGWVPIYCIFAFLSTGVGLFSIAVGLPTLGQITGFIVALHATALLLGNLGAGAAFPWFDDLLMEYTGQTPFALLSSTRTVIICNFALGFALLLMGIKKSCAKKGLAIGFMGALIIGIPLSDAASHLLQIRTNSDIPLPILATTTSIRVLMGWSILVFAFSEVQPQLRLERTPRWTLSLVIGMLTATLIIWRALIAEGEEHLRETVQSRLEHIKEEITDGLEHCYEPVFGMAEEWAKEPTRRPREPQLHLVYGHRQGLEAIEAADSDYRAYWRVANLNNIDGGLDWRRPGVFDPELARVRPVLTSAVKEGKPHRLALVVPVRSTAAIGFLVATYHTGELLKHILHEHALRGIELKIFDDDNELYANGEGVDRWLQQTALDVYGQSWSLRVAPSKSLVAEAISPMPWAVLFTGLLLTLAVVWVYYLARLAEVRVQRLADEVCRRQQVEAKLQKLNEELEQHVQERTHELANEKELLAVTMESIGDGVITTDTGGIIRSINDVAQAMTGWSAGQAVGKDITSVFFVFEPLTRQMLDNPVIQVLSSTGVCHIPHKSLLISRDGNERLIADSAAPIRDRRGHVLGAVLVFKDVTEAQKMEEELFRSRNLEAIGLLAGGIAHDFNNILTGITGNVSLAKLHAEPGGAVHESLNEAEKAFARARDLTQQLLTFSRGGAPIRKSASVSELIHDTAGFVLRGTNVRAQIDVAEDLWAASIDQGQISQAINNILINATQAMPGGGVVFISAQNREIGTNEKPIMPGRYVELVIRDQGTGIAPENMQRIFEPYFTTKKTGNGLGLATTYSIIKRHKGHIEVDSVEGEGATFRIYLTAAQDKPGKSGEDTHVRDLRGSGRVLVMDDDEQIRDIAARALESLGYGVSLSASGEEAVALYQNALREGQPFNAVILDLTVPGAMGGKECLQQLRRLNPSVRAIVSSGYSNDPTLAEHIRHGFDATVVKPYVVQELANVLREVMAGESRDTAELTQ